VGLIAPPAALAVGGAAPRRSVAPTTSAEVADLIGQAHRANEGVVLWGGGTRIDVGDAPTRYDTAIDLRAVRGVVAHAPDDLVCTVRAGTTLDELATALGPARQRWPVEVADPAVATVGGTIASAAAGPSRLRFQHPRDWVIGCEAVLGDGTVARAGGRVVKNVTGYDLTRLYSGTYGTLAALTEVTLKLVAVDEVIRSFVAEDDIGSLWDLAMELRASHLPLDAVALRVDGAAALHVRVSGGTAAVGRLAGELAARGGFRDEDPLAWGEIASAPSRTEQAVRLSTRPGHERRSLARTTGPLLVYPGTGIAYLFAPLDHAALLALRGELEHEHGALVLERAAPELRREMGTWGRSGTPLAIARALKERFDPHAVLAPGRVPLIDRT